MRRNVRPTPTECAGRCTTCGATGAATGGATGAATSGAINRRVDGPIDVRIDRSTFGPTGAATCEATDRRAERRLDRWKVATTEWPIEIRWKNDGGSRIRSPLSLLQDPLANCAESVRKSVAKSSRSSELYGGSAQFTYTETRLAPSVFNGHLDAEPHHPGDLLAGPVVFCNPAVEHRL